MANCLVLLLASFWILSNRVLSVKMMSNIAMFANDIEESNWKMLENHSYLKSNITIEQKQVKMFQQIRNIGDELKQLEKFVISYDDFYSATTSVIKGKEPLISNLATNMLDIDDNYERLQDYSEEGRYFESTTTIDFAEVAISHQPTSTKMISNKIHQQVIPKMKYVHGGGLLKLITDNMPDTSGSPNQLLSDLFDKIAFIEMKGYAIIRFSYVILELYGQRNYTNERELASNNFRKNLNELYQATIGKSTNLSRSDSLEDDEDYVTIAVYAQNIIKSGWKTVENHSDLISNITKEQKQATTSQKIRKIAQKLWQLEQTVSSKSFDVFGEVLKLNGKYLGNQSIFLDFHSNIEHIDRGFEWILEYTEDENYISLINFVEEAISSKPDSVKMIMDKIHCHINPNIAHESGDDLLKLLPDNIETHDEILSITGQSPNQFLYTIFNKIALTQMKAYAVVQFSYDILRIYGKGYYEKESKLANETFRTILKELFAATVQRAVNVSRHFWRPDPEEYKRGDNYLEISRLVQGYIANEKILNEDKNCFGNCEIFKEVNISMCQNDPFCRNQTRCGGKVYSCHSIDTNDMKICLAPTGTTRRYDYIEHVNGILGVNSSCPMPIMNVAALGQCPYCMCFCDDDIIFSDRYFNLKEAKSDITKNKVVTGLRLTKIKRMIYLQVQQGEMLPYGIINVTTLEWVPVNKSRITISNIYDKKDYWKMKGNDKAVNLDVIQVDIKEKLQEVLTGVRFAAVNYERTPGDIRIHLSLEIRLSTFNLKSGKLRAIESAHTWQSFESTISSPKKRTQIPNEGLDIPTRTKSKNTIVSNEDQFVEFTHTDILRDVGQTTIPFIDSQDVVTRVPTPLSGAGLYYKSSPGYGGFIGLKIVTYDFTKHL